MSSGSFQSNNLDMWLALLLVANVSLLFWVLYHVIREVVCKRLAKAKRARTQSDSLSSRLSLSHAPSMSLSSQLHDPLLEASQSFNSKSFFSPDEQDGGGGGGAFAGRSRPVSFSITTDL